MYAILTEAPTQELDGWSCEMRKTEWQYSCASDAQLRLSTLPYIRTHVQLTMEECRNMTEQRRYQPLGQDKVLHLRTGEWSYYEIDQEGQLLEDQGRLRCHEGGHGPKGHPAPPAHLLVELQVRIQLEPLVVNNGQVRSVDGRLQLPCLARENGIRPCTGRMFSWQGRGTAS